MAGQPEKSLGAHHSRPFALHQAEEAPGMKGAAGAVDKAGNAIGLGLGLVRATQLLQPARRPGGLLEIEQPGIEHAIQRQLAEGGGLQPGTRVEPAQDGRSEEHTSELQSPCNLVCRLLLEKKKKLK